MASRIYLGVGDTAKKVSKIYLGVGDTAKKVKKVYLGVGDKAKLVWQANAVGELAVGAVLKIAENGTYQDWVVVHQGRPSTIYDSSCSGTWVMRKQAYERYSSTQSWAGTYTTTDSDGEETTHSYNNDYANSWVSSYLNGTIYDYFSSKVKAAIKTAKIPYRPDKGADTTCYYGANGLERRVFAPSMSELGFTGLSIPTNDGAKLSYFTSTNSTSSKRGAFANIYQFATRTPVATSVLMSDGVYFVKTNGDEDYAYSTESGFSSLPVMILDKDAVYNPSTSYLIGME